ncbi:transcriptional repressor [bacterium]|nr:transcriptional repressor [bacterium]
MTRGFNNHEEIKRQFLTLLEQVGENLNGHLRTVLDLFFSRDQHFSVEEMRAMIEREGQCVSHAEISFILETFVRYGIARSLRTDDGIIRYEHLHINEHHDHLICTKCGKIIELSSGELERFLEKTVLGSNFFPFYHRLQIYGICADCIGKRQQLLQLSSASMGERVRIEHFIGGEAFIQRLIDMGLQRGTEVKILNNTGAFIIQVGEKRLAIGRGMANKIVVSPLIHRLLISSDNKLHM